LWVFHARVVLLDVALVLALGLAGWVCAGLVRRRSTLSIRNLYPLAVLGVLAFRNDDLHWPQCDGLKWPHLASVVVGVDVA